MTQMECVREHEVVAMVLKQQWPDRAAADLQAHVEACEICSEVVLVTTMLREDHDAARRDLQVPAAGQVWWRAAVRARLEAAQSAARPMTWLHGIAGAAAAGLSVAALSVAWPSVERAAGWLGTRVASVDPAAAGVASMITTAVQQSMPLVVAITACAVLAPIALYFALSDD